MKTKNPREPRDLSSWFATTPPLAQPVAVLSWPRPRLSRAAGAGDVRLPSLRCCLRLGCKTWGLSAGMSCLGFVFPRGRALTKPGAGSGAGKLRRGITEQGEAITCNLQLQGNIQS